MRAVSDRCGLVTDYDDSIGGEGEIRCEAPLVVLADKATCTEGHEWVACDCGLPQCQGWRVALR